jgi:hypothetical protein
MTTAPPDWKMLNAYVDGELSPQDAAAVAKAAGRDPAIADQISLLYHLKGGINAAAPAVPGDLASLMPPERRRPGKGWVAAAVAVVVLLGLSALWAQRTNLPLQARNDELLASARALHDQWLQTDTARSDDMTPAVLDALTRFGRLPVVPDLESTGLSIGQVAVFDEAQGRMLQIGYRGHHGCHLSLFVVDDGELSNFVIGDRATLERSHAWQVGDLGYLLLAQGMDRDRFDLIADKVEHATRTYAPLDSRDRQQLAANKLVSAHCKA